MNSVGGCDYYSINDANQHSSSEVHCVNESDAIEDTEAAPFVLQVIVEFAGGHTKVLKLRRDEDPEDAAYRFLRAHNLDVRALQPLVQHIQVNLQKAQDAARARRRACESHMDPLEAVEQNLCASHPHNDRPRGVFRALDAPSVGNPTLPDATTVVRRQHQTTTHEVLVPDSSSRASPMSSPRKVFAQKIALMRKAEPHSISVGRTLPRSVSRTSSVVPSTRPVGNPSSVSLTTTTGTSVSHNSRENVDSFGDRMHRDAMRRQRQKEAERLEMLRRKEEEEVRDLTFRPKITSMGQSATSRKAALRGHSSWRARRLTEIAQEKEENLMKECTFHPRIRSQSRSNAPLRIISHKEAQNSQRQASKSSSLVVEHMRDAENNSFVLRQNAVR